MQKAEERISIKNLEVDGKYKSGISFPILEDNVLNDTAQKIDISLGKSVKHVQDNICLMKGAELNSSAIFEENNSEVNLLSRGRGSRCC